MVSQHVIDMCQSGQTVAGALTEQPDAAPSALAKELFSKPNAVKKLFNKLSIKKDVVKGKDHGDDEQMDQAAACGNWQTRPSDLFLRVRLASWWLDCRLSRLLRCGPVDVP